MINKFQLHSIYGHKTKMVFFSNILSIALWSVNTVIDCLLRGFGARTNMGQDERRRTLSSNVWWCFFAISGLLTEIMKVNTSSFKTEQNICLHFVHECCLRWRRYVEGQQAVSRPKISVAEDHKWEDVDINVKGDWMQHSLQRIFIPHLWLNLLGAFHQANGSGAAVDLLHIFLCSLFGAIHLLLRILWNSFFNGLFFGPVICALVKIGISS